MSGRQTNITRCCTGMGRAYCDCACHGAGEPPPGDDGCNCGFVSSGITPGSTVDNAAQALADAEQRGAESIRYSTERGARQELWSFIRLHAGKSETQNVSVEWLDAFAPELVSGRFADIGPRMYCGKEQGEHG